jgi:phenylalanyl-tRNA synthetase beta chain
MGKAAIATEERPQGYLLAKISIKTGNCECYSPICIKNIETSSSPNWLKQDLAAVGIRSINNVVDIGNWVMMETGQPAHVFEAKKISGNQLTMRQANDGKMIISLDGQKRLLNSDMVVICDSKRPLVIAGVTSSVCAQVDEKTPDIFIESAYFNLDNIRKTAKIVNVSTESSYRFFRDIDTVNIANDGQRVANLIIEICSREIISQCWKIGSSKQQPLVIDFQPSLIERLCGFAISLEMAENILIKLGLSIEKPHADSW